MVCGGALSPPSPAAPTSTCTSAPPPSEPEESAPGGAPANQSLRLENQNYQENEIQHSSSKFEIHKLEIFAHASRQSPLQYV